MKTTTSNIFSETKCKIEEWIGNDGEFLQNLSDEKAEKLLSWLEENNISIETDMNKVADFLETL
jgi:hypothetical protein